jgi:DnaJ-class molecular chaperone
MMIETNIEYETMDGRLKIDIPKLCEPLKILNLRGKGFFNPDFGVFDDLQVTIVPKFPEELTPEEETLIRQLKETPNFEKLTE